MMKQGPDKLFYAGGRGLEVSPNGRRFNDRPSRS